MPAPGTGSPAPFVTTTTLSPLTCADMAILSLQARADALMFTPAVPLPSLQNVVPTLALV